MAIIKNNKEFDGTLFIGVMLLAFLTMIVLSFINKDFAASEMSKNIMEIINAMFLVIIGYLFRKSSEENRKQKEGEKNE